MASGETWFSEVVVLVPNVRSACDWCDKEAAIVRPYGAVV